MFVYTTLEINAGDGGYRLMLSTNFTPASTAGSHRPCSCWHAAAGVCLIAITVVLWHRICHLNTIEVLDVAIDLTGMAIYSGSATAKFSVSTQFIAIDFPKLATAPFTSQFKRPSPNRDRGDRHCFLTICWAHAVSRSSTPATKPAVKDHRTNGNSLEMVLMPVMKSPQALECGHRPTSPVDRAQAAMKNVRR